MVNLYTSFYQDKDAKRQKELLYCLNKNIENPLIDNIFLIVEGEVKLPKSDKLVIVNANRPTYRNFFDLVNDTVTSVNDISIIANTDIYFKFRVCVYKCVFYLQCEFQNDQICML